MARAARPGRERPDGRGTTSGPGRRLSPPVAFWVAAAALAVTMAFSAAPTPLYVLYQARWSFSTFTITVIYAVYAAGVIVGLVLAGHLSDWYGRRRVLLPALLINMACAVCFLLEPPLAGLLAARLGCGTAVGLTTATATAYLVELARSGHRADRTGGGGAGRRAATVATVANVGGIGVGPLLSGILAETAPEPLRLTYLVFLVLLTIVAMLVLLSPETVQRPDPMPAYRPQRIAVPDESRRRFLAACVLGLASFSVYGVINSLAPTFLTSSLDVRSHAVAGAVAFVTFAAGAGVQVAIRGAHAGVIARVGPALLVPGMVLLTVAIWTSSMATFVLAAALAGGGSGALFRLGLGVAASTAPPGATGEVLAGFFVGTYIGVSVPAVAMGVALQWWSASTVMPFFAAAVLAASLVGLVGVVRTEVPARPSG